MVQAIDSLQFLNMQCCIDTGLFAEEFNWANFGLPDFDALSNAEGMPISSSAPFGCTTPSMITSICWSGTISATPEYMMPPVVPHNAIPATETFCGTYNTTDENMYEDHVNAFQDERRIQSPPEAHSHPTISRSKGYKRAGVMSLSTANSVVQPTRTSEGRQNSRKKTCKYCQKLFDRSPSNYCDAVRVLTSFYVGIAL